MTNKRKAKLLSILKEFVFSDIKVIHICECKNEEEKEFVRFEINRLIAELDYSIKYYEEHKYDTK